MAGMIRKTLGIATLLVLSTATVRAQQLRIAIGAVSVAHLPGIVALEGGYFARQNLHPELIMIRGGPQTVAALLGGDVAFAQVFSVPLVSAKLGGADPVIVAGLVNKRLLSLMTVPSIKSRRIYAAKPSASRRSAPLPILRCAWPCRSGDLNRKPMR